MKALRQENPLRNPLSVRSLLLALPSAQDPADARVMKAEVLGNLPLAVQMFFYRFCNPAIPPGLVADYLLREQFLKNRPVHMHSNGDQSANKAPMLTVKT